VSSLPRHAPTGSDRRRRLPGLRAVAVVATLVVVLVVATATAGLGAAPSAKSPTIATTPYAMPTKVALADTPPPWPLPENAQPYIAAAGLSVLTAEQLQVHYHVHLDIIDNGSNVTVPAGIGFVIKNGRATGITVLHTHNTSGVLHIESAADKAYTLGQAFTEWGVALSATQVGGLQADSGHVLATYVNGKQFSGDPATIRLKKHLEIAIWYGPTGTTPKVPKSYRFPAGL
jgi:hypothetical protein